MDITEKEGHAVKHVVVLDHKLAAKRSDVPWKEGRDKWWQDVMDSLPSECPVEWMDAEAPLFKVCSPFFCTGWWLGLFGTSYCPCRVTIQGTATSSNCCVRV